MKLWKRIAAMGLAAVMTAGLAGCGGALKQSGGAAPAATTAAGAAAAADTKAAESTESKAKADATVLTMTFALSEASPHYPAAQKFKELVEEYTDGAYTVNVFPNSSLAGGDQLGAIQMVQKGTISCGWLSPLVQCSMEPNLQALSIPWIWKGTDEIDAALKPGSDVDVALNRILEKTGYIAIAYAENGYRQLTNNKRAIRTPEDMKGIKFRVLGSEMLFKVFTALGADPMDMNFSELFTGLQQGAVDGQENPISTAIVPNKYYEVQKYITLWNYVYEPHPLMFNLKLWNSFDDATKEAIQKAAVEACDYQREISRGSTADGIKTMQDKGCEVIELTEDEIKAFKDIADPITEEYAKQFDQELVNAIKAANQ